MSENLSPIFRTVSKKFSFKKDSKFYRRMYKFCHPAISQFSMADISFNIACKELNITQTGQVNQLFQRKRHLKSEFALP